MVCRVHSSAICSAVRFGIPREAAEGVEIGESQRRAEPRVAADAGDADHAAQRRWKLLPAMIFFDRR